MKWWGDHPAAWEAATKDPLPPWKAMRKFAGWLRSLPPSRLALVGWPLGVDFMFIYWYWWRYLKTHPPFGYDGIDIKSYAMRALNKGTLSEVKLSEIKEIVGIPNVELSHIPDEDSAAQGEIYFGLRDRVT
jgi:hypothetical protein